MYSYIGKKVKNDHLGFNTDLCYIQNRVITNQLIKRLRCICIKCETCSKCVNKQEVYIYSPDLKNVS